MKIAIVTSCFIRLFPGIDHTPNSISAIAYNIAEELKKRGYEVTLFATSDCETSCYLPKGLLKSSNFKKIKVNSFLYKNLFEKHFKNVIAQSGKFDIIHSHSNDFIPYSRLITKAPTITTMHGPRVSKKENLIYHNEKMVAISKDQKKNNPELNFVGVVHNGIKVKDFKFNKCSDNYVAWLGRIHPIKGAMEAIAAAKKAKVKLIMAGNLDKSENDYTKKIFAEIKKNPKLIKYIGEIGKKEKIKLLSNARATLMPIRWEEPFGLVAVESLSCGTPVIAFNRGGLSEIINKKTGFLVRNTTEMAKAITKADKISRKNCRERAEKKFTIEKMADGYERIYANILKRGRINI
ncbi:MAG: glycosyltransferase family 4 protein [bacterium]